MGRLENIIERNQHANRRSRERVWTSMFFGTAILVIIGLMVFTDLGKPPVPTKHDSVRVTAPPAPDKRIDGVLLRKAPSRAPAGSGSSH